MTLTPLLLFELGMLYKTQQRLRDADRAYKSVLTNPRASTSLKSRARYQIQNLTIIGNISADKSLKIIESGLRSNVGVGKYGSNGVLYFEGEEQLKTKKKYVINSDLTVELDSILVHRIFSKANAANLNELPIKPQLPSLSMSATSSGFFDSQVIFSAHDVLTKEGTHYIYQSEFKTGKWSQPKRLNARINVPGFSSRDPMIGRTAAGDVFLFFASDRPGGFGGYDIWMSQYQNGVLGKAINLGNGINTTEDERAPFFDISTGYLFFSSDGHAGLGGMDIFLTRVNWGRGRGKTFNLGRSVNSPYDDIHYSLAPNGKRGALNSNRGQKCCDQTYTFNLPASFKYTELPAHFVEVMAFDQFDTELSVLRQSFNYEELAFNDASTEFILKEDANIEGAMLSGSVPLTDRRILLVDDRGEVISSTISDSNGKFSFKQLPSGGQYSFVMEESNSALTIDIKLLNLNGEIFGRVNNKEKPGLFGFRPLEDYAVGVWTLEVEDATISGQLLGNSVRGEKVLLIDDEGRIVAATTANGRGKFSFKKLPAGKKYAFVLQTRDTQLNVDVNIKDEFGNVVRSFSSTTSEELFKYRALDDYEAGIWTLNAREATVSGSLAAGRLALDNTKVMLVDENGKVVGISYTDKSGRFTFRQLPPGKKFSFVIEESETQFNIDVAVLDERGNIITRFSSNNRQEVFKYSELNAHVISSYTLAGAGSFQGNILGEREQIVGEVVVLTNEGGDVIQYDEIDEQGKFKFHSLSKGRYTFTVDLNDQDKTIKIQVVNNNGSLVEELDNQLNSGIFRYQEMNGYLTTYYSENSTICGQFKNIEASHTVVLRNGHGEEVACVETNEHGYFQLYEVPFDTDYQFVLDGCDTEVEVNIEVVDGTGATTHNLNSIDNSTFFHYQNLASAWPDAFRVGQGNTLPNDFESVFKQHHLVNFRHLTSNIQIEDA